MDVRIEIQKLFPENMRNLWKNINSISERIEEIRIRVGQPILLETCECEYMIMIDGQIQKSTELGSDGYRMQLGELNQLFSYLCKQSVYAYREELKRGYMTVPGGHRIGIAGEMAETNGGEYILKNVYYLNIRVARQVIGAANNIIPLLYHEGYLYNTLLISPPGYGKTTVLRDAIRQVADGNAWGAGKNVSVVDERMELAGYADGIHHNDLGMRTDVISGCVKQNAIMMLLRSMGPDVIAVDEIGGKEDVQVLEQASRCGCKLLATMHGNEKFDEQMKIKIDPFIQKRVFSRYICLGKQSLRDCKNVILNEKGEVIM